MLVLFLVWVCYVRGPFKSALEWFRARDVGQGQAALGARDAAGDGQDEGPDGDGRVPGQLALEHEGGQVVPFVAD